jgi:hypothetical protein
MRAVELRHEMRRTFRRTTHFSKNEYPIFASLSCPFGLSPSEAGECRASWRFTRFGLPVFVSEAVFFSDSARELAFL